MMSTGWFAGGEWREWQGFLSNSRARTGGLATLVVLVVAGLSIPSPVKGQTSTKRREPQRYAVLVAVDDYANMKDLQFCGNDQRALRERLLAAGFPEDQIVLIHDEAKENRFRPFKANIEKQLSLLLEEVGPDDLIVVSFSGHGVQPGETAYFCPADGNLDEPATLIPLTGKGGVYDQLQRSKAALKFVIVDACRDDPRVSGKRSGKDAEEVARFSKAPPPPGIVCLRSCGPGQTSQEDPQLKHGVFMHYVLEGLGGKGDSDGDGFVSLDELSTFAARETKKYVRVKFNDYQSPDLVGEYDLEARDFRLARITTGTVGTSASTAPKMPAKVPKSVTNPPAPTATDSAASETATNPALKTIKNSIGMELVLIPAGKFRMGSPPSEKGRSIDEDQVDVTLTREFYLGKTEVTQAQWRAVMRTEPWKGSDFVREGESYPATYVSWDDAQAFCRKLSESEQRTYRLPTEAEWEYACRAGTTTRFSFGDDESQLGEFAWFGDNAWRLGEKFAHATAGKSPNSFGLYDMHGNVWEWCEDAHMEKLQGGADPKVTTGSSHRVHRGGNFLTGTGSCSSASRSNTTSNSGNCFLGFRIALSPPGQ